MSKPAAIITTLEDSVPWLDQRLVSAYLHTTYRILTPLFDLKIGTLHTDFDRWLAQQKIRQFAFITAWNPASKPLSLEENERRNQDLEKELRHFAKSTLPGIGIGDDPPWPPEASFCALDISPADAVELGKAFEQNALVFGKKGNLPELWWLPEK